MTTDRKFTLADQADELELQAAEYRDWLVARQNSKKLPALVEGDLHRLQHRSARLAAAAKTMRALTEIEDEVRSLLRSRRAGVQPQ
jgi:hypothetical protein